MAKGEIKVSRNIEINYLNTDGSYEVLYPKVNLSNVTGSLSATYISGSISSSNISSIPASKVTAGTFAGMVEANSSSESNTTTTQLRNVYFGTTDMTAGSSVLPTGEIYLVYE